ncbi:MAG: VanZ family protein [Lachnospiraceae bacterium]|nr:VanZ family protein [Lachnospiraceae bacterium]
MLTLQKPDDTKALSRGTWQVLAMISEKMGIEPDTEWWNSKITVRYLAHTAEYFMLGLAAGLVFNKKRYALLLCMFISFADQVVKTFVPTRHFDWNDFPFDITGFASAILIVWIIQMARRSMKELDETHSVY